MVMPIHRLIFERDFLLRPFLLEDMARIGLEGRDNGSPFLRGLSVLAAILARGLAPKKISAPLWQWVESLEHEALPMAHGALFHPEVKARMAAVECLARIPVAENVPALRSALVHEKVRKVRDAIEGALAAIEAAMI